VARDVVQYALGTWIAVIGTAAVPPPAPSRTVRSP
jgi:hypothetical protein